MAKAPTGRRWSFTTRQPDKSFLERFAIDADGAIVAGSLTLTEQMAVGSNAIALGNVAPDGTTTTSPSTFVSITIGGAVYLIPAWLWVPPSPSGFPMSGLVAWWKGDVGLSQTSGLVTTWADQSGNGYDLAWENSNPDFGSGAINYVDFNTGSPSAMENPSLPWGTAYSVLVACQNNASSAGRLVDFHYPATNRYIWVYPNDFYYKDDTNGVGPYDGLNTSAITYVLVTVDPTTAAMYQDVGATPSFLTPTNSGASGAPSATTGVRIGGLPAFSQSSLCKVWEAAIWDHALDTTERNQLTSYLATRSY